MSCRGRTRRGIADLHGRLAATANSVLDAIGEQVVFLRAGDWIVVTFGVLSAIGAVVALGATGPVLVTRGMSPRLFAGFAAATSASVVVGSWLLGALLDRAHGVPAGQLLRPTFVSWGGIAAAAVVLALVAPAAGLPVLFLLDVFARTAPLGHVFGRIGCLSYGCCHGRPSAGGFGIRYRNAAAKAVRVSGLWGVRLHPSPLYECAVDGVCCVAANALFVIGSPRGMPAAAALLLYGAGRFLVERTRDDGGRRRVLGLSPNEWLSVVSAAAGAMLGAAAWRAGASPPPAIQGVGAAGALWIAVGCAVAGTVTLAGFGLHRRAVGRW